MRLSGQGLILVVFFLPHIFPAHAVHSGNETDKLSLLAIKEKIDDDPLGLLDFWNDTVHFCSWPGLTCHRQRVTELVLTSWNLKGQLSPHIGNMSFLRTLNISSNRFNHEIPSELGRLLRLRMLQFRSNNFSGEIPVNISGCSRLEFLGMVSNNLVGRIPEEIGSLSELQHLQLAGNNLVGRIPASIGNLSSLLYLFLSGNSLQGSIPYSIGNLRLKVLVLPSNNFTGTIPPSVFNISTIEYFDISRNKVLEGNLPPKLGQMLPNLQTFLISRNNFSGSLPASLSNASNLIAFQINFNEFTGKVPSFSRSSKLRLLLLHANNLGYARNGDLNFVNHLVNCTELEKLGFALNNFGGKIPEAISNMTSLENIEFGVNRINGTIPTGIGNLVNLQVLSLEMNQLTGFIPSSIGKLTNLNVLNLPSNELSGTIPSSLGNLTSLSELYLNWNNFQGKVPQSLGECKNLQILYLSQNNLSGSIPSQLVSLQSLSIAFDLSQNQLTGPIPIEVEKLVNLGILNISENKLSGEIPKTLSSCKSLEYLNLRGNLLAGSIPEELSSLRGLEEIDLSRNKLSGEIPEYFADFGGLGYLNFSFNDFEGELPQRGLFLNASKFSIMGNTRLCGGLPELKLQSCIIKVNKNNKFSTKLKLVIIIPCVAVALTAIFLIAFIGFRSRKRGKPVSEPQLEVPLRRASYADLVTATNGFSSDNLIGVGSFGSVYKGTLNQDGTLVVAVKVLNLQASRALKSFVSECESLRLIRHRNLVKLLTVCSSIDFKGNDFKALVYKFMENGNLDEWLHCCHKTVKNEREQSRNLNLTQRINIAIDVANVLDYLHSHSSEPIAHCDIKPSNILLDTNMVAHIGDFGLTKLLKTAVSTSSNQASSSFGVRGTVGYVASEYGMGSEVSTLGDVYSFGILLLEMFTAKRPTDNMFKDEFNLPSFVLAAIPVRVGDIVDPMLLEEDLQWTENSFKVVEKALISILEIGVSCSSNVPGERKNIGEVSAELCRVRDMLIHRKP